ncbi:ABC transporter permease [Pararhizobium mangrovi]|uniref:Spermidine/putrescine transport system permease protein PotC n=1 Tax=Pararhizobium mangrovi TaxID=2590452 RepID=A0A506U2D5_9HYPH|nr:ABC transporter permease [Pararhizobium mangrovi]TPW27431.1 ABC transporter permease [Pararhizobium mangrovi]
MRRTKASGDAKHWPGLAFGAVVFFAYVYLPILILVALSFNENRTVTMWTGFSLKWYAEALANQAMLNAAWNSLVIASVAAVCSTFLATLCAVRMARDTFAGKTAVNALVALPLAVPEIVPAVATLMFFATLGVTFGLGTVIVAHTVFCLPFAYLPIRARLEGMDARLPEAAADLYANPRRAFFHVTLPLLMPGILSGLVLAFIISLDDFITTFFVGGAGSTTLPLYIFGLVRIGVTPQVNAISSLMLVLSLALVSLSLFLSRSRDGN